MAYKMPFGGGIHRISSIEAIGASLMLLAHTAAKQDLGGLALACKRILRRFPWRRLLDADSGYQGDVASCAIARQGFGMGIVEHPRGVEGFQLLPKSWLIESILAGLERNRRLAKNVEGHIEASAGMITANTRLLAGNSRPDDFEAQCLELPLRELQSARHTLVIARTAACDRQQNLTFDLLTCHTHPVISSLIRLVQ